MSTREIRITQHFDDMIEADVASGRFSDASEAIGEALRLLELRNQEEQEKLDWLRSAAKEGFDALDRGEGVEFNSEEELRAFLRDIHDEVASELENERKSA